ncbi:MAG: putative glycoside hydrolase [Endomicrobium sp.]|uniref:putative glycoside hydrolase n=1 Tax=Candidatus Endomicrobiellum pyrsonymphae TaxID=1408203 RepID=UPI003573D3EE|nr:putative glycoside hydrolase [Endomicrobium sp.]
MKTREYRFFASLLIFLLLSATGHASPTASSIAVVLEQPREEQNVTETVATTVLTDIKPEKKVIGQYIRGIHLSVWVSGSEKRRRGAIDLFDNTELNTAVIDIKEYEGKVYIDGIKIVDANNAYVSAVPDIKDYVAKLKEKGVYTIARIVVFRDNTMTRKKPKLAVKNPDGTIWTDRNNIAWLDPYNQDAWDYNLQIAERAVSIGFDEIQFDYIRFPSDGNTKNCRYSKPHSATEASKALVGFLKEANRRLKNKGAKISIDVFGLTTTATDDMGIGQRIIEMTEWVDYVSPMVYPSHYGKWNYGIAEPNKEPYKVVYYAIEGALKRIPSEKLRPWLQDFSFGHHKYGKDEVRTQIQACYDNKIGNWLLWNSRSVYTRSALRGQDEGNSYQESDPPTSEMLKTAEKKQQAENTQEKPPTIEQV